MENESRPKRLRERLKLALPVRVTCRESADHEWVEITRLIEVTPFGAGFTITHPTECGRRLHLTLPMPRQLRCFDHIEDQYRVWALVRHVEPRLIEPEKGGPSGLRFEVGVAFIGKNPPTSYQKDPATLYDVDKLSTGSTLWAVRERPKQTDEKHGLERSEGTRIQMAVMVVIEMFDDKGAVQQSEQTVTENISRRGAAVMTSLAAERGRFVRMTSVDQGLSVLAAVRARRVGADGIPRLHLEFSDKQWPLEGLGE